MMKFASFFKLFLETANTRKNMYSWCSSGGNFYPVEAGKEKEGHWDKGREIIQTKIINNDPMYLRYRYAKSPNYYEIMFRLKWQRITYSGNTIYTSNPFYPPTTSQKSNLIDLAIDHDMTSIVYDNDEDTMTIWTK